MTQNLPSIVGATIGDILSAFDVSGASLAGAVVSGAYERPRRVKKKKYRQGCELID